MPKFRVSLRAEADLMEITRHTLGTWGELQAVRYLDELEACCQRIADNQAADQPFQVRLDTSDEGVDKSVGVPNSRTPIFRLVN